MSEGHKAGIKALVLAVSVGCLQAFGAGADWQVVAAFFCGGYFTTWWNNPTTSKDKS